MSKKQKKVEADQFEAEQNLTPPDAQASQPAAVEAKKPNGFISMLQEANERRKARVKKYLDGKGKQA